MMHAPATLHLLLPCLDALLPPVCSTEPEVAGGPTRARRSRAHSLSLPVSSKFMDASNLAQGQRFEHEPRWETYLWGKRLAKVQRNL